MADDSIQITLPDGSSKAAPAGIRVGDFVKESIGAGLAKAAVLARAWEERNSAASARSTTGVRETTRSDLLGSPRL